MLIRTCAADGTSYNGFKYPMHDRRDRDLPGLEAVRRPAAMGCTAFSTASAIGAWLTPATVGVWQVLGIVRDEAVDIDGGKVKVPRAKAALHAGSWAAP
jgi:hypothetical protein